MKLRIIDSTLRDGEQQSLINFSQEQKIEIALWLKKIGVDYVDLMPCQNEVEAQTAIKLKKKNVPLSLLNILDKESIDQSLSISSNIRLFQAVSDDLLLIRYKTDNIEEARKKNIENFIEYLKYAKNKNPEVEIFVSGEDTTRADKSYLLEFVCAIEPYSDVFIIADSKGTISTEKIKELVKFLKDNTNIELGIHTHNDLGLANVNAIEAIKCGATVLSGTFTGIGERAGNSDIRKVLEGLKKYGIKADHLNYDLFEETEKLVRKYAKRGPASPGSAEAFWHETGIHVNALLKDPIKGYNAVDPKTLGHEHKVFFGKKSGVSNFKYYLKNTVSENVLIIFRDTIKKYSIKENRSYSFEETIAILKREHPEHISPELS